MHKTITRWLKYPMRNYNTATGKHYVAVSGPFYRSRISQPTGNNKRVVKLSVIACVKLIKKQIKTHIQKLQVREFFHMQFAVVQHAPSLPQTPRAFAYEAAPPLHNLLSMMAPTSPKRENGGGLSRLSPLSFLYWNPCTENRKSSWETLLLSLGRSSTSSTRDRQGSESPGSMFSFFGSPKSGKKRRKKKKNGSLDQWHSRLSLFLIGINRFC